MSFPSHASPVLLEAVSKVLPGVTQFSECPEEGLTERQVKRIRLSVARSLFDRNFKSWGAVKTFLKKTKAVEGWDNSSSLTEAMIVIDGIGDNSFYLNEFLPRDEKLSQYVTLRDYDESDHNNQEAYFVEEGHRPDGTVPYSGRMLWSWARWYDDGLVYGNISMARHFFEGELDECVEGIVDRHFQTEFVDCRSKDKKVGSFVEWDMVEMPISEALQKGIVRKLSEEKVRKLVEGTFGDRITAGKWIKRATSLDNGERNETILFSNIDVLSSIRIRNWVEDISSIEDGADFYDVLLVEGRELISAYVERAAVAVRAAVECSVGEDHGRDALIAKARGIIDAAEGLPQRVILEMTGQFARHRGIKNDGVGFGKSGAADDPSRHVDQR